jgi:hypothetical protein
MGFGCEHAWDLALDPSKVLFKSKICSSSFAWTEREPYAPYHINHLTLWIGADFRCVCAHLQIWTTSVRYGRGYDKCINHHAAMQHQQGGVAVYVYIALARSRGRPGWLLASICMIKLIAKQQAANWMPKFSVKHSSYAVNRLNVLV